MRIKTGSLRASLINMEDKMSSRRNLQKSYKLDIYFVFYFLVKVASVCIFQFSSDTIESIHKQMFGFLSQYSGVSVVWSIFNFFDLFWIDFVLSLVDGSLQEGLNETYECTELSRASNSSLNDGRAEGSSNFNVKVDKICSKEVFKSIFFV